MLDELEGGQLFAAFTDTTSNAGFCAGVCDAAGIAAIAAMSTRTTGFIISPPKVLPV
jgi:hypothetical protein